MATATTGYADGLSRLLSNKGFMMFNGERVPIVGRMCMDQMLLDVTDTPEIMMGSVMTIVGESGCMKYAADNMADNHGTIGYEVIVVLRIEFRDSNGHKDCYIHYDYEE